MRTQNRRGMVWGIVAVLGLGLAGCAEKSGVETKTEVTGPNGTTTETKKVEVKQTGENPPPAPSSTTNP